MDVFISWSGKRSHAVAQVLRDWLPMIINALNPWLSSADIDKGARWDSEVAKRLESAKAGIICLTSSNLHSDWILFEAGALSKTVQNTYVCTFLDNIKPSDVGWPLAQFQATQITRDDMFKLIKTLNNSLGSQALQDQHVEKAFDHWWPTLEAELKKLPAEDGAASSRRSERELLEEILSTVRVQNRSASSLQSEEGHYDLVFQKAMEALLPQVDATSSFGRIIGDHYVIESRSMNGKKFRIFIPRTSRLDEVSAIAKNQYSAATSENDISSS